MLSLIALYLPHTIAKRAKKKKKRKASDDLPRHASLCTPRQSQADSVAARRSIADTSDISDCEVAPTPYRLGSPWTSAASPVLRDLCGARTWERISFSHPHYGHPYPCRHWDEQSASHRGRVQTKRRLALEPPGRNDRVHCLFLPASSLAFAGGEQSTNAGSSKCALAEAHSAALLEGSPNLDCATGVEGTNDDYSLTTLCRASQRVSRFIEDVQGSKKLFKQLQRHGHYVKQFECEFAVEAASPEIFYRVFECLELCPNIPTLQIVYKDRTISPGRMQSPEPLFKYLSQRHAARLENFTFSTSLAASGLALPAFLDDFLAQCSSLTTLHLALEGLKAVPSALDLIAARIRRLPRLQDLWVPSTDFIRPTGALVSPSPIRHIHIADSVSIGGLECIQREYGATLEHLQVGGIRLPDCGEPALLFPALCSLQIKYYSAPCDAPLTSWLDPKTPLKVLNLRSMGENSFSSLQEFVRLQPLPTLKRLVLQEPEIYLSRRDRTSKENREALDRNAKDVLDRVRRSWLWAEPLGIEVLQDWYHRQMKYYQRLESRSISTCNKALRADSERNAEVVADEVAREA